VYAELLTSQALLGPLALDTLMVPEKAGQRVALMDLLGIGAAAPARRVYLAVRALRQMVKASEDKKLGAVRLSVTTEWPSVSLALTERLVSGVNQFNLETRKSQAAAELQFVEVQAGEAEHALREAEDRLQLFLQRNRAITGSPELAFQHDRLQRDVALRQQVYTSLVESQEEARIRLVRDTPVITVLEEPQLPVEREPRNSVLKSIAGGVSGGILGVVVAFVVQALTGVRREPNEEAREFFDLVQEATPRLLRLRGPS
jgi:capsule polysaccharide export protein KpsE/RkpR